jgi:outer membrane protein
MKNKVMIALGVIAIGLMAASKIDTDSKKFGYVNSMEILTAMPEMKTVEADLETYGKELDADYQKMVDEYQKKVTEYQKKEKEWSDAMKQVKQEELMQDQQRLQKTQQVFEDELMEKQQKLLAPLITKIETAINEVAKEKGLSYVFDTSKGMLLYADQQDDITKEVKEKLKIPTDTKTGSTGGGSDKSGTKTESNTPKK